MTKELENLIIFLDFKSNQQKVACLYLGIPMHEIWLKGLTKKHQLSRDEEGVKVDEWIYRAMIGSLVYLTASQPNLCLSIRLCAWHEANPKVSHFQAVKRTIKYVRSIQNYEMKYLELWNEVLYLN